MRNRLTVLAIVLLCALSAGAASAAAAELAGTSWQAVSVSDGHKTERSVVKDSEITAFFGEDGALSGSAGHNDYKASVKVSGKKITIRPTLVTNNDGDAPEGIMEQEALYLKALESAKVYRITRGGLELLKANGKVAAAFVPLQYNGLFLYKLGQREAIVETLDRDRLEMTYNSVKYPMMLDRSGSTEMYRTADGRTSFWTAGDRAMIAFGREPAQEFRLVSNRTVRSKTKAPVTYKNGLFEAVVDQRADDAIFLTANGETHWLNLVPSASGERYQGEGGKDVEFWVHGNEALLTIKGRVYSGGELVKVGTERYTEPAAEERLIDDDAPEAALLGTWRVETVAGARLLPGTSITFSFTADGRVAGNATVNNFFATWIATGDRLVPGRVSTSRVGGSPEHMKQENTFLDIFDKTRTYEVRGNRLTITSESGAKITAAKK